MNQNLRDEIWKGIPDLNDKYLISTYGRIYSIRSNKILKPVYSGGFNGPTYLRVVLCGKKYNIHRLVAITFIPNPENKPEVDHIDRNTFNNNVENLRWATRIENRHNRRK